MFEIMNKVFGKKFVETNWRTAATIYRSWKLVEAMNSKSTCFVDETFENHDHFQDLHILIKAFL